MIRDGWLGALCKLVMVLRIHAGSRASGDKRREEGVNQKFSESSTNQNSWEDFLKPRLQRLLSDVSSVGVTWGRELAFLSSSQVMLVLLSHGQHFENHYPKTQKVQAGKNTAVCSRHWCWACGLHLPAMFGDRPLTDGYFCAPMVHQWFEKDQCVRQQPLPVFRSAWKQRKE